MTVALVTDEQAAALLPVGDAVPIVESALRSLPRVGQSAERGRTS